MSSTDENANDQSNIVPKNDANEEGKIKEEILKPKYPDGLRHPGGPSAFLQRRLQKGQRYFDSADYQMAKQNYGNALPILDNKVTSITSENIPTPETVPVRKMTFLQPSKKYQIQK